MIFNMFRIYSLLHCIIYIYANNAVSINEMAGLQALYESTNGDNWDWNGVTGHWDFSIPNVNPWMFRFLARIDL